MRLFVERGSQRIAGPKYNIRGQIAILQRF
jgi:hypothetical protein